MVGRYFPWLIVLTLAVATPLASDAEEEHLDAELRCTSDDFRSAMDALEREEEESDGIDPAVGLIVTLEPIQLCPEAISLANRRFQWVTQLESPSARQILDEFERVAKAFELAPRAIVPGAFRRPVEYLTDHGLEVERCIEILEYALTKIRDWHEAWPWGRIPEEKATRMVQGYRISQADVLVLLSRAYLALDSTDEAAAAAERVYALALDIESGPDVGASKHLSFQPQY